MSKGKSTDWADTLLQIKYPNPCTGGKTWLRHKENSKAGTIDRMILEGKYTVTEIAQELKRICPNNKPLATQLNLVEGHIKHLQEGEGWGFAKGEEPHRLRIRSDGRVRFDII